MRTRAKSNGTYVSKATRKGATMRVRRLLLPAVVGCAVFGLAAPASATAPEIFRFPEQSYSEPGFGQCDGFALDLAGSQTEDFIVFRDESGRVVRVIHQGHVTETFTNSVTGESLTNRGDFMDTFTRIDGTDDFTHTVVGFDFMAALPGEGLVLQQVGRTVFSLDGEEIVFFAGQSNISEEGVTPLVCAAIS
jgi:hypothetical protein